MMIFNDIGLPLT